MNSSNSFRGLAAVAAALLLGGTASLCQAAPFDSPVGTWDCLTAGGGQPGIAYLTFSNITTYGGSFSGFALVAGAPPAATPPAFFGGRSPGGDIGRYSITNLTTTSTSTTNSFVFGFTPVNGFWEFNNKGRIIGAFNEVLDVGSLSTNYLQTNVLENISNELDPSEVTNILVYFDANHASATTNYQWATNSQPQSYTFDNPAFTVSTSTQATTNAISFVGTVVLGKRMNLVSSTSFGKVTYRGVPADNTLPNLDGTAWYGTKQQKHQKYVEFFNLQAAGIANYPNIYYTTNGVGPSYTFSGVVVVSKQKKIGFVFDEASGSDFALRATVGGFISNSKITRGSTQGIIEPGLRILFGATQQPSP